MVAGEDGIIDKAQLAAEKTKEAIKKDEEELEKVENRIKDILNEYDGYNKEKGVNAPKLGDKMIPVKWSEEKNCWLETTENDNEWYDYIDTSKDGKINTSKWANAIIKNENGEIESFWVWIPRYAYSITSGYHELSADGGTILIKFLKGTSNELGDESNIELTNESGEKNWNVHPAFKWGNDVQLSGIWVGKFEASRADATLKDIGKIEKLSIRPGVTSWRNITINDSFIVCENYNKVLNSHQMKNSEWGAVAYLAHSGYGRNGKEIGMNQCKDFITGAGPNGSEDVYSEEVYSYDTITESIFEKIYSYTGSQGQKASTTGNVYGVYDLSGCSWERVASYIDNENESIENYGASLKEAATNKPYMVDVYDSVTKSGKESIQSEEYEVGKKYYGDAVYETSGDCLQRNGWFYDWTSYPYAEYPFFARGCAWGNNGDSGIFYYNADKGEKYENNGFRPVLVIL